MKIIISSKGIKRLVDGPYALCVSKEDLELLKAAVDTALQRGHIYGWLDVTELTPRCGGGAPLDWDEPAC